MYKMKRVRRRFGGGRGALPFLQPDGVGPVFFPLWGHEVRCDGASGIRIAGFSGPQGHPTTREFRESDMEIYPLREKNPLLSISTATPFISKPCKIAGLLLELEKGATRYRKSNRGSTGLVKKKIRKREHRSDRQSRSLVMAARRLLMTGVPRDRVKVPEKNYPQGEHHYKPLIRETPNGEKSQAEGKLSPGRVKCESKSFRCPLRQPRRPQPLKEEGGGRRPSGSAVACLSYVGKRRE